MHPRNLCLIGLAAIAACARPPLRRLSLLADPAAAEVRRERVGASLLSGDTDENRISGWSAPETGQSGGVAIWTLGDRSELRFDLVRSRPLTLSLTASPYAWPGRPEARMEILLNGSPAGSLSLPDARDTAGSFPLPEKLLRVGENRLSFIHPWGKSPLALGRGGDARPVAVWFTRLSLEPAAPEKTPRTATLTSYTFPLPSRARAEFTFAAAPHTAAEITVFARRERLPEPQPLARLTLKSGESSAQNIRLPGEPGEWVSLTIGIESAAGNGDPVKRIDLLGDGPMPVWADDAPPSPPAPSVPNKPPHTVLIFLVDALRADHLPVYGYDRPTAPELDGFSRSAQKFSDAWAVSSWTKPAVASILTGLPPESNGAGQRLSTLGSAAATAPDLLKARGYHSAAIVASPNVSAAFGFSRGFDEFHDLTPDDPHAFTSDAVVGQFRKTLAALPAGQPLFAYLHLVDPHTPYGPQRKYMLFDRPPRILQADPPDPHFLDPFNRRGLSAGAFDNAMDRYDGEILQADAAFGAALAALRAAGRLDGALIVFVADHGEEFGDHGGTEHGATLFSEVCRVPLLIRWPDGHGGGATETGPVSQLDLLPTILRAAGIAQPALPGFPLQSPSPATRLRYASLLDGRSETSLRDGPWDYHFVRDRSHFPGQPQEYLFDLARDPGELHNLAEELPLQTAWLRARLKTHTARLGAAASSDTADPQLLERLKRLGYLH